MIPIRNEVTEIYAPSYYYPVELLKEKGKELDPREPRILAFVKNEMPLEEKEKLISQLGDEWATEEKQVRRILSFFQVATIRVTSKEVPLRFVPHILVRGLCGVEEITE